VEIELDAAQEQSPASSEKHYANLAVMVRD
jgi:hypothetical protein